MQTSIIRTKIQNHIPYKDIYNSYISSQSKATVPDVNFDYLKDKSGKRFFDDSTSQNFTETSLNTNQYKTRGNGHDNVI